MSYEIIETKFINLNSNNATLNNSSMLSNVLFPFTNILSDDSDILYAKVGILNAQIPVSWLLVNDSNNKLYYRVFPLGTKTITMTNGNYSGTSFIAELTRLFLVDGYIFSISLINHNGTISLATSNSFTLYGTSTIFSIMGFAFGTNYFSTANSLNSPYALNLLGNKKLKINSSALSTDTLDSSTMGMTNNICTIPINVASWGLIDYVNNGSNMFSKLNAKSITMIDIQITNEYNQLIDFGNIGWCITIELDITKIRQPEILTLFNDNTVQQPDTNDQTDQTDQQPDTTDTTDNIQTDDNIQTNIESNIDNTDNTDNIDSPIQQDDLEYLQL